MLTDEARRVASLPKVVETSRYALEIPATTAPKWIARCAGVQKVSRPIDKCQEMSQNSPPVVAVAAMAEHHTYQAAVCAFSAFVRGHETKQPPEFLHPYFHLAYMASCEQAGFFRDTKPLHAKFQKIRNTLELLSRLSYCQEYTSMSHGERRVIFDSHAVKRSGPRIGMRSPSHPWFAQPV